MKTPFTLNIMYQYCNLFYVIYWELNRLSSISFIAETDWVSVYNPNASYRIYAFDGTFNELFLSKKETLRVYFRTHAYLHHPKTSSLDPNVPTITVKTFAVLLDGVSRMRSTTNTCMLSQTGETFYLVKQHVLIFRLVLNKMRSILLLHL